MIPEVLSLEALIPLAVPVLVAQIKHRLPTWAIPVIAIVCGVLLQLVAAIPVDVDINPLLGVLLGLAGVGLREVSKVAVRWLVQQQIGGADG